MVVDTDPAANGSREAEAEGSYIDVVIISHEFTNHMHKETLLEIFPCSWRHFSSIHEIPRFNTDWRLSSVAPLPEGVGVSRIAYPGRICCIIIRRLWLRSPGMGIAGYRGGEEAEAVIYTP